MIRMCILVILCMQINTALRPAVAYLVNPSYLNTRFHSTFTISREPFILKQIRTYTLNNLLLHSSPSSDVLEDNDNNNHNEESFTDLQWRIQKLKLEEDNKKRFLKAGPRFLSYKHCREWVIAWGGRWKSEQDWKEWIDEGEKRNSYIPARPDDYYGNLGKWISWEHFLGVDCGTSEENRNKKSNSTSYFSYFQ